MMKRVLFCLLLLFVCSSFQFQERWRTPENPFCWDTCLQTLYLNDELIFNQTLTNLDTLVFSEGVSECDYVYDGYENFEFDVHFNIGSDALMSTLQDSVIGDVFTFSLIDTCVDPEDPVAQDFVVINTDTMERETLQLVHVPIVNQTSYLFEASLDTYYSSGPGLADDGNIYLSYGSTVQISYGELIDDCWPVDETLIALNVTVLCDEDHLGYQLPEINQILLLHKIATQTKKLENLRVQLQYIGDNLPEWEGNDCDNNAYEYPLELQSIAENSYSFAAQCFEPYNTEIIDFVIELAMGTESQP